ncbi:MAG: hypothetical protein K2Q18_02675 [Bdellovibrionales bacterium]|nr:hypothetical protein [Bdellovibrionales bacterium]
MKKIILILLGLVSFNTIAVTLPTSKVDFCGRFAGSAALSDFSNDSVNLMTLKNQGGLFNGGVCWWHSRFQRNIFYLSIFRPDLPKLNPSEAKALIKEIRAGKSIVSIPGFHTFSEFTEAYKKEILSELEAWQLYDGVVLGSWIDGLKGDTQVKPEVLKNMMETTYKYVEVDKKIAYQKLQIKGITSHAWLIVGMKAGPNGYEVGLIDSNNPMMSESYSYKFGDKSFNNKSYGNFVPYLEFTREEERLATVAKTFCNVLGVSESSDQDFEREYKLDLIEAKRVH